jgi:hypothetical protein
MRGRRHKLQVSTFPFLAVLLCAMGSLILVLLVMDRKAHRAAQARAQRQAERLAEDTAHARAECERMKQEKRAAWEQNRDALHSKLSNEQIDLQLQMRKVRDQLRDIAARLHYEQDTSTQLRRKVQDERGRLNAEQQLLSTLRSRSAQQANQALQSNKTLHRMTLDLLQMEQALKDLKASRQREQHTFSVVPYHGRRGENRRPIYVECAAAEAIFHPERKAVTLFAASFTSSDSSSDVRGELQRRIEQQRIKFARLPDNSNKTPYLLFLVRPDGIQTYQQLMQIALELQKDRDDPALDFGYELIDADWILDFPADDELPSTKPWMTPGSRSTASVAALPATNPRPASLPARANRGGSLVLGAVGPAGRAGPAVPLGSRHPPNGGVSGGDTGGIDASVRGATNQPGQGMGGGNGGSMSGPPGAAYPGRSGGGYRFGPSGGAAGGVGGRAWGSGAPSGGPPNGGGGSVQGTPSVPGLPFGNGNGSGGGSGGEGGIPGAGFQGSKELATTGSGGSGSTGSILDPPRALSSGSTGNDAGQGGSAGKGLGGGGLAGSGGFGSGAGGSSAGGMSSGDGPPLGGGSGGGSGIGRGPPPNADRVAGGSASAGGSAAPSAASLAGIPSTGGQGNGGPQKSGNDENSGDRVIYVDPVTGKPIAGPPPGAQAAGEPPPDGEPNNHPPRVHVIVGTGGAGQGGEGGPRMRDRFGPTPVAPPSSPRRPVVPRPAWVHGGRDWTIYVECRAEDVVLHPEGDVFPLAQAARNGEDNPLRAAIQRMIDRRQAMRRPDEPPYHPKLCLLVRPQFLRAFLMVYPALEALPVPKSRRNLDSDDDVSAIVTGASP